MYEYTYLRENLRRLRSECRWSQAELARRAGDGFSQAYVSRLEGGLRPSEDKHVDRLASVFGLERRDLLRRVRRRVRVAA